MNNTFDLELHAHTEALVYKRYTGEISEEEEVELSKLLATHPHLESIQQELDRLIAAGVLDKTPHISLTSSQRAAFEDKIHRSSRIRKVRQWAVAASVLVLLGVGGLYFFTRTTPNNTGVTAGIHVATTGVVLTTADGQVIALGEKKEISTPQGSISASMDSMLVQGQGELASRLNELKVPEKLDYAVTLPDGTRIRLNSATILRFPFAFQGDKREVYIDGEAYFTVASNVQQPFIVNTPSGSIEVLGTEFNVNTYVANRLITSLVSGATIVHSEKEKMQLSPGQEATVLKGNAIEKASFDPSTTLSWMKGVFYFDQAPLKEITSMVERWYGYKVVFDDLALRDILLTAHLNKHQPIQSFLTMLQNTTSIKSYFKEGSLHLH
ncbi:FecR family protein [Chitinophaga cymbidii]|uniref:Iron dicitrate transporter FecR n=1 Tax=Chitinophaga cymbidii TaxID=1096750 RepID=A0A512RFU8_9BACT|nr:FecR domain-containing protein [Chitinophaga cymbidii]GEP94524.1 hypothetical protein CCY01nite_07840 [Chitinophaga cymbidii]